MGGRVALKPGTVLKLTGGNGNNGIYTIEGEIGRGNSCIVYEGSYLANSGDKKYVRIKECCPCRLDITRNVDGTLEAGPESKEPFEGIKGKFAQDFSLANDLFYQNGLEDSLVNMTEIYPCNNTIYVISSYSTKETLVTRKPDSIKACMERVCELARMIGRIHEAGYLCLDIKPDNILYINNGIQERSLLIDFDSLIAYDRTLNRIKEFHDDQKLSYSAGFAAIELQMSNWKKICPATDVYALGALLFYLLYGKTPNALHCEEGAVFGVEDMRYDATGCDDRLAPSLTEFFRHTLANYPPDRYQTMAEVAEHLILLSGYADTGKKRVYSTSLPSAIGVIGRDSELEAIDRIMAHASGKPLFVSGMGGIGKSTLVREYIRKKQGDYDCILYLLFNGSTLHTIIDDNALLINKVQKADSEKEEAYFERKLRELKLLVSERTLLVIDNFEGILDEDFRKVLELKWKVIVISRKKYVLESSDSFEVGRIKSIDDLITLFEENAGRKISGSERALIEDMIQKVSGHTLVLKLIARQVANSHITISEALALTERNGFSRMAPETVDYEKDSASYSDTIGNIIGALFDAGNLSEEKKILLKIASLLPTKGMDIRALHSIMEWCSYQNANELEREGWLVIAEDILSLHPVIREAISRWEWKREYWYAVQRFLGYFYKEICIESVQNDVPKKLRDLWIKGEGREKEQGVLKFKKGIDKIPEVPKCKKRTDKIPEEKNDQHGINLLDQEFIHELQERLREEKPADMEKLKTLIFQAQEILGQCRKENDLRREGIYRNLLSLVIEKIPSSSDEYILTETEAFLEGDEVDFASEGVDAAANYFACCNPDVKLKLLKRAVCIYAEREEYAQAEELLQKGWEITKKSGFPYAYAHYYDMVSEYYDYRLNGAYTPGTEEEEFYYKQLYDNTDLCLRYAKKYIPNDFDHLYIKNLLVKITLLIRSMKGSRKELDKMIREAEALIRENTYSYASVRFHYHMVCAWYHGLVMNDEESVGFHLDKAKRMYGYNGMNDLDRIDSFFVPAANIYLELGQYEQSEAFLQEAVAISKGYPGIRIYMEKECELLGYLLDVALYFGDHEKAALILKTIDEVNEKYEPFKVHMDISESLRDEIKEKVK